MLRTHKELHSGAGTSRPTNKSLSNALRARRPVRPLRLGVCAFKDWFSGLVQQHKEPQPQPVSQTATQEQHQTLSQPSTPSLPKNAPKRDFLEARQVSLFQLFDASDYKFDIPAYQRPYAWRTKQIYELLQDFVKAYETRQEYFLGAIVATRSADGANVPYQLIDGQQRLTSLVLLLAFLHGWARQQGNEVLEGRIRRMLYLEADPLEGSNGRYRLHLRDTDDEFFRCNILDAFLPQQYRLTGLAAAAAATYAVSAESTDASDASVVTEDEGDVKPLENETWWRLYENASFLRSQLDKLVSEGLNLQEFAFHVLRNCFVVLMVARDEGASFRIFSTLNGRGMDLSAVDKLKADLLAGELTGAERRHFADAWADMESVLGRAAFHRVFDYMRELAAVRDSCVRETSVLEYFTRRVDDASAVKQVLQVALDYARLLLQLRQASWAAPELAALLAEPPLEQDPCHDVGVEVDGRSASSEAVAAAYLVVSEQDVTVLPVLTVEDESRLLKKLHEQHRQWNDGNGMTAAAGSAEVVTAAASAATPQPNSAATISSPPKQEEDDVLVFRFDDAPASNVEDKEASAAATSIAVLSTENANSNGGDISTMAPLLIEFASAAAPPSHVADITEPASPSLDGVGMPPAAEAAGTATITEDPLQPFAGISVIAELTVAEPALEAAASSLSPVVGLVEMVVSQPPSADDVLEPLPPPPNYTAVAEDVVVSVGLVEDPQVATRRRQAALLAELDTRSRHLNLFTDEAWLPPLLEFFYQTEDLELRAAFMKDAEALQLLLELQGDPAVKAARWGMVSNALLQRPFRPEGVLAALRLTDEERQRFRARLDSKDLYGTADQRTLRHLLVRCEPPSVCQSVSNLSGLLVERVVPQSAPEGSTWRKTRISSPCNPQSAWPDPWFATATVSTSSPSSSSSLFTAAASNDEQHAKQQQEEEEEKRSFAAAAAAPVSFEVKYWYEVQRLNWHGKLGNLVLLPATASSATTATSDYDVKAALWRQAGVASRLPGFTGPLVDELGRYGRFRFCYDECRQRHADMFEYLIAEFEL